MTTTPMLLDVRWNHGTRSAEPGSEPPIQVFAYDEQTYILRQSKTLSYEAPFMFLLVGEERALLMDTGATTDPVTFPLRATVDRLIGAEFPLVVAHTHGHGDHVAADAQFAQRPHTTVVDRDGAQVQGFFGFTSWPDEIVTFDLGSRVLEIIGSPGHHRTAITVFDPHTGFLLTGDTVYRGRLYTEDYSQFLDTLHRLVAFTEHRPVSHVIGCHIEMSRKPGHDYPIWTVYQPDEPQLEMTVDELHEVRDAAVKVADRRGAHRFDNFIIYNNPTQWTLRKLVLRGKLYLLGRKLAEILR